MKEFGRKPYLASGMTYLEMMKAVPESAVANEGGVFQRASWKKPYKTEGKNLEEMMHYFDSSQRKLTGNYIPLEGDPYFVQRVEFPEITIPSVITVYPPWVKQTDYTGSEGGGRVCASVNNKIYIIWLRSANSGTMYEYDPIADTWTSKSPYPGDANTFQVATGCNGKIYCGTGLLDDGETPTDEWYEYTPTTDSWVEKTNFGGGSKHSGVAVSTSTKVYVGLGSDGGSRKKDWWEYDPDADGWTAKTDYGGSATANTSAFCVNDKIYTGMGTGSGGNYYHDWWEYDPVENSWTEKAEFPGSDYPTDGRYLFAGGVTSTKIYLGSGYATTPLRYMQDWWEYNPSNNQWTQKNVFPPGPRAGACGGSANGNIYIGLGFYFYSGTLYSYKDWWEYTP